MRSEKRSIRKDKYKSRKGIIKSKSTKLIRGRLPASARLAPAQKEDNCAFNAQQQQNTWRK